MIRTQSRRVFGRRIRARAGLTFIELIVAVTILGVLAAIAVPSMQEFIAKRRVQAAADALITDLRLMRSIVLSVNKMVQIEVQSNASLACYVISDPSPFDGDCSCLNVSTPVCKPGLKEYKSVRFPASEPVRIQLLADSDAWVTLDRMQTRPTGLIEVLVSASNGGTIKVSTNWAFVPTACSMTGKHAGYPTCP